MNIMDYHIRSAPKNRLYRIYKNMKQRCLNANDPHYHNYGGRGISICDEWLNDFDVFCDWALANGYDDSLTIDRINNNGDYKPDNCRWTDMHSQSRNKQTNINITIDGTTKVLRDWCLDNGIRPVTAQQRIYRGWSGEDSIASKVVPRPKRYITYNGKTQTLSAWSREVNIPRKTLEQRINNGWSIERALIEPPHNNGRKM